MKRTFALVCAILLSLSCAACTASGTDTATAEPSATAAQAEPEETAVEVTADELNVLIRQYMDGGDFENAYLAACKLMELEPNNADAYLAATDALLAINEQNEQEIKRLLAEILTNAPDTAQTVDTWMKDNGMEGAVELPFLPDYSDESEVNTVGNTAGNMTNALRNEYWRGGFVATQAGWVYFSRFTDDYAAIYKMRTDGSELQRVGEAHGYSLNVVGDWLYFINADDESKPYRMRTDGSKLERLADFACSFLTVSGDWAYSDGYGDEGTLCKFKTDGTEQSALTDFTVIDCCAYGDWVYFYRKSTEDGGLLRIGTDGSGMQVVVPDILQCYVISDDVVYYPNPNDPFSIMQCDLDGENKKEIFRADDTVTAMNVIGDTLAVAYGISFEQDGLTLSQAIVMVDLPSGEVTGELKAATEPLCVGEGCLFYTEDGEGMRWHCLNLETGEDIPME